MMSYVKQEEYNVGLHAFASAHDEAHTRAIVMKIGGSLSPFWGAVHPINKRQKPSAQILQIFMPRVSSPFRSTQMFNLGTHLFTLVPPNSTYC